MVAMFPGTNPLIPVSHRRVSGTPTRWVLFVGFLKLHMNFGTPVALGIAVIQGAESSTDFCKWSHLKAVP